MSRGAAVVVSARRATPFAAPHLAGQAARLRSRYPTASPFEIKALLAATASASPDPLGVRYRPAVPGGVP